MVIKRIKIKIKAIVDYILYMFGYFQTEGLSIVNCVEEREEVTRKKIKELKKELELLEIKLNIQSWFGFSLSMLKTTERQARIRRKVERLSELVKK